VSVGVTASRNTSGSYCAAQSIPILSQP
jgi:hypothetical protein